MKCYPIPNTRYQISNNSLTRNSRTRLAAWPSLTSFGEKPMAAGFLLGKGLAGTSRPFWARRPGWRCDVGIIITGAEGLIGGASREDLGPRKWHWPLHHHDDDPWAGSRLGLSRLEAGACECVCVDALCACACVCASASARPSDRQSVMERCTFRWFLNTMNIIIAVSGWWW